MESGISVTRLDPDSGERFQTLRRELGVTTIGMNLITLQPGERGEALAAGAPDQREVRLARKLHAPGGEARARDQDGNAHPHGLDHHLRGETAGGVEDLVRRVDLLAEHPARDLVDRVVAADVFHIDQRPVFLSQHTAMDRAGFKVQ